MTHHSLGLVHIGLLLVNTCVWVLSISFIATFKVHYETVRQECACAILTWDKCLFIVVFIGVVIIILDKFRSSFAAREIFI